jgi:geranylgeranyl diphosphate synthase, type I
MATLEDRLLAPLAPRPAELVLMQAHDAIDVHLRAAVHRLSPPNRRIVEYHIGWTGVDGRPARRAGKAIRPALALLGAQAVGEPVARAMPGAVAVEMVHNFSLLQDDIMDGDVERRNRPAAWTVFGESQVLCASDALARGGCRGAGS